MKTQISRIQNRLHFLILFRIPTAYCRFLVWDKLKGFYKPYQVKKVVDFSKMEYNMDISKNEMVSNSTNTTPVGYIEDEHQLSNTTSNVTRSEEDCSEMEAFLQVRIYIQIISIRHTGIKKSNIFLIDCTLIFHTGDSR